MKQVQIIPKPQNAFVVI